VHAAPVPRVGGIAMAIGILAPALILLPMTDSLRGLLFGVSVLLVFGVWDDRANLGYRAKFAGQVLAVMVCLAVGHMRINLFPLNSAPEIASAASTVFTFVFLVGVTNAMNLSDGLDGLAGGMALLCCCALALLGASGNNSLVTALALIEAGAVLGFLRFNTHPARVFMGDSGSQMLGFTLGVLAILATQSDQTAVSSALPFLLLGIPVLDTFAVMAQRIREGRSPFSSDRNHLHHKLLTLGFAHAEAVSLIYLLQGLLFLIAYFLRFESDVLIVATFSFYSAALLLTLHSALRHGWQAHDALSSSATLTSIRRHLQQLPRTRLPVLTLAVMSVSLLAYATTVIAVNDRVGSDVGLLCLATLIALILMITAGVDRWLRAIERTALYVGVVLIVYLDQTAPARPPIFAGLSWTLLSVAGLAALLRYALSTARRFEVTSLDLLVVFIALVVPNLPGLVPLPADLSTGVAKAVILLYVVEMLLVADIKRALPRTLFALMLGAIALRAFLAAAM
jgi:UDP-GlcNAc:undecaprenyl-phosphate GlcNAc-1-phosphate transferase